MDHTFQFIGALSCIFPVLLLFLLSAQEAEVKERGNVFPHWQGHGAQAPLCKVKQQLQLRGVSATNIMVGALVPRIKFASIDLGDP